MLKIKADKMNDLEKFGFEDWGKYYALNPNVYSNSPLKGLFTCRNVFVDKDTRKFSCGFINYEAESVFNALFRLGYRKQSETVKEFAEKVGEAVYDEAHIPIELKKKGGYNQFEQLAKRIKYLAEQFGKEE